MSRQAVNTNSNQLSSSAGTKLCHIVKRPDFDGYGFNLHSEKIKPGQYIGKVDINSPAEAAGLKEGDRILQVNGVAIGDETHKQVVQRIKAISNEVRLLLLDVDAKTSATMTATSTTPTATTTNNAASSSSSNDSNGNNSEYKGIVKEIPGASANISSISMISTKRMSNSSQQSNGTTNNNGTGNININNDELDAAAAATMPLPPSVISATMSTTTTTNKNNNNTNNISNGNSQNNNGKLQANTTSSSLQLPLTAREMRAKLMSKKKYDPKLESVDLKKKFDIIKDL